MTVAACGIPLTAQSALRQAGGRVVFRRDFRDIPAGWIVNFFALCVQHPLGGCLLLLQVVIGVEVIPVARAAGGGLVLLRVF